MTVALIILVLVLLNGFFVAAEFAIIGAPRATIEHRAAQGEAAAAEVLAVLKDPRKQDRYIATAQLGITSASLGLGMYGEHQMAIALVEPLSAIGVSAYVSAHMLASVVAVACLTYLHIVLGEMIPKTLALQYAASAAMWIASPMKWAGRLFLPLVMIFNAIGVGFLRLFGIRRVLTSHAPSADTLQLIVAESVEKGELSETAGQVLEDLFAFRGLTAGEVMTPRVHAKGIERGASAAEIRSVIASTLHARYPVYEDTMDKILGIVLVRDVLADLVHERPLSDASIRKVPFVPETTPLDLVLSYMRRDKTQLVVVMDEHGGTAGIVTVEDLFEEVVGEITDSAHEPSPVSEHPEGEHIAMGFARLDEVGEELGVPLEHPDVDTVSGLVLCLLNRPPSVGDVVTWANVELRVVAIEGHGVAECVVRLLETEGDARDDEERA